MLELVIGKDDPLVPGHYGIWIFGDPQSQGKEGSKQECQVTGFLVLFWVAFCMLQMSFSFRDPQVFQEKASD